MGAGEARSLPPSEKGVRGILPGLSCHCETLVVRFAKDEARQSPRLYGRGLRALERGNPASTHCHTLWLVGSASLHPPYTSRLRSPVCGLRSYRAIAASACGGLAKTSEIACHCETIALREAKDEAQQSPRLRCTTARLAGGFRDAPPTLRAPVFRPRSPVCRHTICDFFVRCDGGPVIRL